MKLRPALPLISGFRPGESHRLQVFLGWLSLTLLVLFIIATLLFDIDNTLSVPFNLHSELSADYSRHPLALQMPAIRLDLVQDALEDFGSPNVVEQIATLQVILQTPAPSVTPGPSGNATPTTVRASATPAPHDTPQPGYPTATLTQPPASPSPTPAGPPASTPTPRPTLPSTRVTATLRPSPTPTPRPAATNPAVTNPPPTQTPHPTQPPATDPPPTNPAPTDPPASVTPRPTSPPPTNPPPTNPPPPTRTPDSYPEPTAYP